MLILLFFVILVMERQGLPPNTRQSPLLTEATEVMNIHTDLV